jgi:hypothetical protein
MIREVEAQRHKRLKERIRELGEKQVEINDDNDNVFFHDNS